MEQPNISITTTESSAALDTAIGVVRLAIEQKVPWRFLYDSNITLAFAGYLFNSSPEKILQTLVAVSSQEPTHHLAGLMAQLDGHFAIAVIAKDWGFAAVDRVRSIPLFYALVKDAWTIDDHADRLRRAAGLGPDDIDADAALTIGMAGYTVGLDTLYRGLEMVGPGECVTFQRMQAPVRRRYYTYRPWLITDASSTVLKKRLAEVTLRIMEKHLASLNGRPLVIPLSAGNDSRLIASAARHVGYREIRCFAYGRTGSFEAEASRAIAEKLGVPWAFAPLTVRGQRRYFTGRSYSEYLDFSDTCAAVPFVQDMTAHQLLKSTGFIPEDAVIINGNTGDFISGNHIVASLREVPRSLTPDQRHERILSALVDKHFALWGHLRTPVNIARIRNLLTESLNTAGAVLGDPEGDHGIYEYSEFHNRQCKYVITGQRVYEFLGHEWRLPLWDRDYLDFWQSVPLRAKVNQKLYTDMLREENWGGVWDIPVNRKTIRPLWLVPIRLAAKVAHAPFGANRWHKFEQRIFQYWLDQTCNSACVSYWQAAKDNRGQRISVSWLAEQYLIRHQIALNALAHLAIS